MVSGPLRKAVLEPEVTSLTATVPLLLVHASSCFWMREVSGGFDSCVEEKVRPETVSCAGTVAHTVPGTLGSVTVRESPVARVAAAEGAADAVGVSTRADTVPSAATDARDPVHQRWRRCDGRGGI